MHPTYFLNKGLERSTEVKPIWKAGDRHVRHYLKGFVGSLSSSVNQGEDRLSELKDSKEELEQSRQDKEKIIDINGNSRIYAILRKGQICGFCV